MKKKLFCNLFVFENIKIMKSIMMFSMVFSVQPVFADTDTQTFNVKLNIISTCDIHTEAATDVDFGSQLSTATDITAVGELKINCTNGTTYNIGLNEGLNFSSGSRYMKNATNILVPYDLYQDSSHAQAWGNSIGTDTLTGTGNGTVQPIMIYGKVRTAGENFIAGDDYIDEVTATVTY